MATTRIPLVTVQPSALDVIRDVTKGKVTRESFWATIDNGKSSEIEAKIDVYRDHETGNTILHSLTDGVTARHITSSENNSITSRQIDLSYNGETYTVKFPKNSYPRYENTHNITDIDVSPGGELLAISHDTGGLEVISQSDGSIRRQLEGHYIHTTRARFFASGQVVLSCGDLQIKLWSVIDSSNPRTMVHRAAVTDIAMIGRGRNILSSSEDGTVKLWECGSGDCLHTFEIGEPVVAISVVNSGGSTGDMDVLEYETSGRSVIVGTSSRLLSFDLRTKEKTRQVDVAGSNSSRITALSAENNTVVTGDSQGEIIVWDWKAGQVQRSFSKVPGSAEVNAVCLQDGLLVVASQDTTPVAINLGSLASSSSSSYSAEVTYLCGYDTQSLTVRILNNRVYIAGKASSLRCYTL